MRACAAYLFSESRISRSRTISSGSVPVLPGRGPLLGLAQAIHLLDHHEDDEGQDDEIDHDGQGKEP